MTVPLSTPPGMYYLVAYADADQTAAESTESNNTRTATSRVKIGADLTVVSVDPPDVGGAGEPMTIDDIVSNAGTAPAPATDGVFYLSMNTSLDPGDVEIGRRSVPGLAAGQSHSGNLTVIIPESTDTGSYYIIEAIDVDNAFVEAVETNNTARSLAIRIGPDLSVTALASPNVTAGTAFTVTESTRNSGGATVGASATSYVLSTNTTLDAADISLGSRTVPALPAGGTHATTTTLVVPANLAPAYYYLFAVADAGAAVVESSETNNTRRVLIRVSAP
jgi:subtilase family serine protease